MNKALQIVSIQHELVLAIGGDLNVKEMLRSFMRVCIQRLSLTSIHAFLYRDEYNRPHRKDASAKTSLSHFLSVPELHQGLPWSESLTLSAIVDDFVDQNAIAWQGTQKSPYLYCFCIPDHGVMILESVLKIDDAIIEALHPVFEKLAKSCYGCLSHGSLVREIAARKIAEDTIVYQAHHDELTQLSNRRRLSDKLNRQLNHCRRTGTLGALIFIDLNEFKSINDVMGHEIGDQILRQVAARFLKVVRNTDTVARFGGDEFIVLLSDLGESRPASHEIVKIVANNIAECLKKPISLESTEYQVTCSMGYELFPRGTESGVDVIKNADLAMYEAKGLQRREALAYQPEMSERLNTRLSYITELKEALKFGEFELYYQPQYDFGGVLIGAEALLRWHNPKRSFESPSRYIPIAEESDLIYPIGEWVVAEACRHIKMLDGLTLPLTFTRISVNVSAKQLSHKNFLNQVVHSIHKNEINAALLGIEITENVIIKNANSACNVISKLRDYGIQCAIDDFGTGYSSLSYLKKIPAQVIKIDRSFVSDINVDSENRSIARMIIALGENLGVEILAEGVETYDELDCLAKLGCNKFQGFYFDEPMPFAGLLEILEAGSLKIPPTQK